MIIFKAVELNGSDGCLIRGKNFKSLEITDDTIRVIKANFPEQAEKLINNLVIFPSKGDEADGFKTSAILQGELASPQSLEDANKQKQMFNLIIADFTNTYAKLDVTTTQNE